MAWKAWRAVVWNPNTLLGEHVTTSRSNSVCDLFPKLIHTGDSQKSRELQADTSADVDAYSNVDDDLHPEERDDRHCAHVTLASLRDLFSCRQAGLINIRDVYLAECARVLERIMVRAYPQRNSQPIPWVRSKSWDSYTASWPRLPAIVPKQETEDLRAVSNMTELLGLHTFARKTWQPSSWPRPYRMWARTLSLGTCLSLMPCTQATPIHHKGPAENIQDGFDEAWQILLLFAPYVVSLIGLGRVLWIVFRTSREFKDPFHSRVFAFAAAFTWWIVRSMEGNDHTSAGSVILAVFLACWACFMAECRRPIRDKTQYLLSSIFSGCLVSLLITAMVFIPTFEPTKKGK